MKQNKGLQNKRKPEYTAEIFSIVMREKNKHPDLRMMQILGNVYGNIDPYYIEDSELLEMLEKNYEIHN